MLRWSLRAPSPYGKLLTHFRFAGYARKLIFAWQLSSVFLNKGELVQVGMKSEKRVGKQRTSIPDDVTHLPRMNILRYAI